MNMKNQPQVTDASMPISQTIPTPDITTQANPNPSAKLPRPGIVIASLILGFVAFIPLLGVLAGIIAIILGVVGLSKIKKGGFSGKKMATAGIVLGVLGILFSIILYGSLYYFGFVAKNGPFSEPKKVLSEQLLIQNAGYLELYKKKHGVYPQRLEDLSEDGYTVFPADDYLKPFHYQVSEDGQSYELRSLGPDGVYGTDDDIFPSN